MAHEIKILNCYFDDWMSHPGWWAQMKRPEVQVGDEFDFTFEHKGPTRCRVTRILGPGDTKPDADDLGRTFSEWWVIQYDALPGAGEDDDDCPSDLIKAAHAAAADLGRPVYLTRTMVGSIFREYIWAITIVRCRYKSHTEVQPDGTQHGLETLT